MKTYLLSKIGYGKGDATKVIIAQDETTARKLANDNACDEGKIWTDPKLTRCEVVSTPLKWG